jgi:FtsP/CotA-like multicopper oxidase with cupredoxin domain
MQYQWLHRCARKYGVRSMLVALALLLAGMVLGGWLLLWPRKATAMTASEVHLRMAATDGWIKTYGGRSHYILGFVSVPVEAAPDELTSYRGQAQLPAPPIIVEEGQSLYLTLTNIGFSAHPDLDDSRTIHWSGFPNALPLFDDSDEDPAAGSVGRDFTYYFDAPEAGTYMWHCHFSPAERFQMGMVGPLIVRPAQDGYDGLRDKFTGKYAYNDGDGSTRYDREFILLLSELDAQPYEMLPKVQDEWSEFRPDHWLLNGRAFPHTIAPDADPDLELPSQPVDSIIEANSGEQVLLRLLNLGNQQHTFQIPGIPLRVVGKDARLLRGYDGADLTYWTNTLTIEPGETYDVIFTAPPVPERATARVINRHYSQLPSTESLEDGLATKIVIHPAGLPPQKAPNE